MRDVTRAGRRAPDRRRAEAVEVGRAGRPTHDGPRVRARGRLSRSCCSERVHASSSSWVSGRTGVQPVDPALPGRCAASGPSRLTLGIAPSGPIGSGVPRGPSMPVLARSTDDVMPHPGSSRNPVHARALVRPLVRAGSALLRILGLVPIRTLVARHLEPPAYHGRVDRILRGYRQGRARDRSDERPASGAGIAEPYRADRAAVRLRQSVTYRSVRGAVRLQAPRSLPRGLPISSGQRAPTSPGPTRRDITGFNGRGSATCSPSPRRGLAASSPVPDLGRPVGTPRRAEHRPVDRLVAVGHPPGREPSQTDARIAWPDRGRRPGRP